jgi:RNA polymerase sigma factor (sigma-70 family)
VTRRDPLANPEALIRRVYAYAAYRLGGGPEAEDVTSDVFERALRYRDSYDPARGEPTQWLVGIARRCVDDALSARRSVQPRSEASLAPAELESDIVRRLDLETAIATLDDRARDLVALRYGADLTARQIGELLGLKTNAVEVALHRALARLREELQEREASPRPGDGAPAPGVSP